MNVSGNGVVIGAGEDEEGGVGPFRPGQATNPRAATQAKITRILNSRGKSVRMPSVLAFSEAR